MNFWHSMGEQLRCPHGLKGIVVGHAMRWVNRKPNSTAIQSLHLEVSDTVLELGFGPGDAIARMAKHASQGQVYGIDASATMLAQAVRRNQRAQRQGQVRLTQGDFSNLPWGDAVMDKILAVNVAYFWKDPAAVVTECHRVLRPGGKIAIYVTDASTMRRWKFAGRDTHALYGQSDLFRALQEGGFSAQDITVRRIPIPMGIKGMLAVAQKQSLPIIPITTKERISI